MSRIALLVGYGWFAGIPEGETNNAELIARALDGARVGGMRVRGLVVPVTWAGAFPPVERAIAELRPDAVLALGTDARAAAMRPEPCGVNWQRGAGRGPGRPHVRDGQGRPDSAGRAGFSARHTAV